MTATATRIEITAHDTILAGNLFANSDVTSIDEMASARKFAQMLTDAMQSEFHGLEFTADVQNASGCARGLRINCDDYDTEQKIECAYERATETIFNSFEWIVSL